MQCRNGAGLWRLHRGRTSVRRGDDRCRGGRRRRRDHVRRQLLQPFVCALRSDRRGHLPGSERMSSRRRALSKRRRLLRLGERSGRKQGRQLLQQRHAGGRRRPRRRPMRAGNGLPSRRYGLPARGHVVQRFGQLLQRERRSRRADASLSLSARRRRNSALHASRQLRGRRLQSGLGLLDERGLLRARVRPDQRDRRRCSVRLRRLVRAARLDVLDQRRLLPGASVRASARRLERHLRRRAPSRRRHSGQRRADDGRRHLRALRSGMRGGS